jgi:hypothetical protein
VELTDAEAEKLLANGSVAGPIDKAPADINIDALMQMPLADFEKHLGELKLAPLQELATALKLDTGAAKTKAEYALLIKAAHPGAAQ